MTPNLIVVEIQNKTIVGKLEQLDTEPSIVLHVAYEITRDVNHQLIYTRYPLYAQENICVFNSVHILTMYPASEDVYEYYTTILESSKGTAQLLLEEDSE